MPSVREAVASTGDRTTAGGPIPEGASDRSEYAHDRLRAVAGGRLGGGRRINDWRREGKKLYAGTTGGLGCNG